MIPFKKTKEEAVAALKNHVKSKKLVPKLFKDNNHIDEIKGVYIPFWLFDADVSANITYNCDRIRAWDDSDNDYIEHNIYDVYRAGTVQFEHVPVDGSSKMPDDMMESIEPFDFSEAMPFNKAVLAGYMADKYDVDANMSIENANERIRRSTCEAFEETVHGFTTVTTSQSHINLQHGIAKYALYPVWMLNTSWQGNTYTFAMNGQTGKFVGDLPLDKGAYARKLGLLGALFSCVGVAIGCLIDYMFIF